MDFQNNASVAQAARINGGRSVEFVTNVNRWAREGRLFTASQGLEATDIPTVTTEAETTPICSVQSPSAGIAVIPLRVYAALTNDGGGLTTIDLAFTKAAAACATALTLSGTTLNIQNHYTKNPQAGTQATALYTVTASALLTSDYITLAHGHAADAALTTGLIQINEVFDYEFTFPLMLVESAALLLYGYTASGAGNIAVSITWAEVPIDELV